MAIKLGTIGNDTVMGISGLDEFYPFAGNTILPGEVGDSMFLKAAWTKSCCSQVQHLLNEVCL